MQSGAYVENVQDMPRQDFVTGAARAPTGERLLDRDAEQIKYLNHP